MLHLEMYKGTSSGGLTQWGNWTYHDVPQRQYERRSDLLNPTPYLDQAKLIDPEEDEGRVNEQVITGLNVRREPSTASAVMFRLPPWAICKILDDRVVGDAYGQGNRTDWYKIEYEGKQGFVAAYYVDYNPVRPRNNLLENYPKPFQKWVEVVARSNLKQHFKVGIIAQSLHESGRGTSELALTKNNFNGMQFRDVHKDIEGATPYPYRSSSDGVLTDYVCANTPETYLECYLAFINRDHYQGGENTDTAYNFIKHLYDGGYATDPEYMSKVDKFFSEAKNILFFDYSQEEHGWYKIVKCTQDNEYYLVCMAGGEALYKIPLERTVADLSTVLAEMLTKYPNARTWAVSIPTDLSSVPLYPLPPSQRLQGKRFLLDPGHSAQHPGAQGYYPDYPQEHFHVARQAEVLATFLREQGATVDIYNPNEDFLSAIGRRAANHDMFISLHLNSVADPHKHIDHYSCVMVHSSFAKRGSKEFAALCADKIADAVDLPLCAQHRSDLPKGVYPAPLGVLRAAEKTNCPVCVLCESFLINAMNSNAIVVDRVEKAAEAIFDAIVEWYS
ncbi:glucosaminidase domain-containing protein [Okeania sp. SIO2C2]|uniref:glucosaminidase domain-containing protein n=1 Tax=Okeania sp. SIO2C2 TaxID=2607787 RepID=UPI00257E9DD7|nr:glucosaminidase domain-containing protein [Okeania sp. SIO2C2]